MTASRFAPDEATAVALVATANQRAERLALRIVTATKAIKAGQPSSVVLALLGPETQANGEQGDGQ